MPAAVSFRRPDHRVWPGANYVTWVGIDGFYTKPCDTFNSVFVPTIDQVRTFSSKLILLSETAVARHANQYANIINLFNGDNSAQDARANVVR